MGIGTSDEHERIEGDSDRLTFEGCDFRVEILNQSHRVFQNKETILVRELRKLALDGFVPVDLILSHVSHKIDEMFTRTNPSLNSTGDFHTRLEFVLKDISRLSFFGRKQRRDNRRNNPERFIQISFDGLIESILSLIKAELGTKRFLIIANRLENIFKGGARSIIRETRQAMKQFRTLSFQIEHTYLLIFERAPKGP
jgi:hypothetical protein